jgi:hypothetical protein
MRLLKVRERVTLNGRDFEVVGFTSMSVKPKRVFLRDLGTGDETELAADALRDPPELGSHETP